MVKREFKTWASRCSNQGKYEFHRFVNPLNELSFAQYMKWHQIIDGEYRRGDNWQKGIPFDSLFESAFRHMQALWLMYYGYTVNEINRDGEFDWVLGNLDPEKAKELWITYHTKEFVEQLNAIRFNTEAMKLQLLTGNVVKDEQLGTEQEVQGGKVEGEFGEEKTEENTESKNKPTRKTKKSQGAK